MIQKATDSKISGDTIRIENYREVLDYICSDIKRSIKLSTYLKDELTKLFGKHNTRFKGEFYYYVWIVLFEGEKFEIYTANGKGTQFEINAKFDDKKSKECINFLRKMEELLDSIGAI